MPDETPPNDDELLRERYLVLSEQLKRLVKTEQRLSLSERALGRQIRRVDALNRLTLQSVSTPDPSAIFDAAIEMLFAMFPYEQGVGLLAGPTGTLDAVAVGAVVGREEHSREELERLAPGAVPTVQVPAVPVAASVSEMLARNDGVELLVDFARRLFAGPDSLGPPQGTALVLPLFGPHAPHRSAIVLVRKSASISFHDSLPVDSDRPFLDLVAQQVSVALTNAHLVSSLKDSYEQLERTQSELIVRERLAAIGELAAVVAHEVRNPLGAIFNSLATLDRIAEPAAATAPLLDIVREEANRVNRIVGDLIDFARPGAPFAKHDRDLTSIAREAVANASPSARARDVSIHLERTSATHVSVDEHLFRHALLNLIDNAIHASPQGGRVDVSVRRVPGGATVAVRNHGPPIPDAELGRIFEPFYTTKASGTGLGLAVVKRFADAHDGKVEVTSSHEAGTVFTIRWQTS